MKLFSLHRLLSGRRKSLKVSYRLFVSIGIVSLLLYWGVIFFSEIIKNASDAQVLNIVGFGVVYLIVYDLICLIARLQDSTLIEPRYLSVFPLPPLSYFFLMCSTILTDLRVLLYFTTGLLFLIFLIIESSVHNAIIAFCAIGLLYITLTVWVVLIYQFLFRVIKKNRQNLNALNFVFLMFINFLLISGEYWILTKIPILNQVNEILQALIVSTSVNLIYLFGSILLTALIGFVISNYLFYRKIGRIF